MRPNRCTANRDADVGHIHYQKLRAQRIMDAKTIDSVVEYCKRNNRQYHSLRAILKILGVHWSIRIEELSCKDSRLFSMPIYDPVWTDAPDMPRAYLHHTIVAWNHTHTPEEAHRHNLMAMAIIRGRRHVQVRHHR
jgi:hypothetical protein